MECQTNNLFHKYTQVFLNLHHFLTPRNLYPNVLEGRSLEGIVISRENAEEKKTQLLKNSKEKNSTCYKKNINYRPKVWPTNARCSVMSTLDYTTVLCSNLVHRTVHEMLIKFKHKPFCTCQ